MTLGILWASGLDAEKINVRTILLVILTFLLSAIFVAGYAKLFNFVAEKWEGKGQK
ncbi:hypothetical protein [Austwickia chelonae]|uniref:hypothetical protein n=1 Tax=Austwickia chelonae TaxID=100225 RepID=UPI0013C334C7|nr:hypothetical protein [Austwickia chelonae]